MIECGTLDQDELLWGAAWLHKASRRREYREYIFRNEVVLRAGDTINEFGWDNKHAGINVLISKVCFYSFTLYHHHSSRNSRRLLLFFFFSLRKV